MDETSDKEQKGFYWKLHVQESIGTLFLGILCIMLLVSLMKSEERSRALMNELMRR
jgi:hypothetical protein